MLDLLAKQFIFDPIFCSCAFSSFLTIAKRFKLNASFTGFAEKLAKVPHWDNNK